MLKLPDDSTVELLKASIGKKAGILITKVESMSVVKIYIHTHVHTVYPYLCLYIQ